MAQTPQPPAVAQDHRQPHVALRDLHRQLLGTAHLYDDPHAFASGVHSALVAVTPIITELTERAAGRPSIR